jgi:hypothetical protein
MIIKGNARAGAKSLAEHLLRADTNERVELGEIRGTVAEDLFGALKEMEAVAICTRTSKAFYHASVNVPIEERLTPEQRAHAIERLEKELGLTDQPRAIVIHEKHGREHTHIVWSRIDFDHSRAIRMDHNYRTHEIVARELEREFGHARVQGAHIEREGSTRPERTPSHHDMQQGGRTGLTPKEVKEWVTEIWRGTDSGQAFKAAIEEPGWILARGDRRDFVIVDPVGGTHSLARRVEGAKAKDIRERMADVDIKLLPSVADARTQQLARQPAVAATEVAEEEQTRRPTSAPDGLDWTDRGGMVAQERSAMQWAKERAGDAAETPGGKNLRFFEDRNPTPEPGSKPDLESDRKGSEKRLKFFEDKKPDKDIDRDR